MNDTKAVLTEFVEAYERLADEGKADAPGGAEFARVLNEYLTAVPAPDDARAFIFERANEVLP